MKSYECQHHWILWGYPNLYRNSLYVSLRCLDCPSTSIRQKADVFLTRPSIDGLRVALRSAIQHGLEGR